VAEHAPAHELYSSPKHPYTGALLSAVPIPDPKLGRARKQIVLEGDVPNPINPPSGCVFHPRCPRFHAGVCDVEDPPVHSFSEGHDAKCHYPLERWPLTGEEMRERPEEAVEAAASG
jgi:oligopeptide/dipeptide ABC transporter ATP-binding protein